MHIAKLSLVLFLLHKIIFFLLGEGEVIDSLSSGADIQQVIYHDNQQQPIYFQGNYNYFFKRYLSYRIIYSFPLMLKLKILRLKQDC